MIRVWHTPVRILTGLVVTAVCAMPQANMISARPGAINYIEGTASINDKAVSSTINGKTFLGVNDTLSTGEGKAEILLTPGVFLRVGDNSAVRMISPTLTRTQVELLKGNAMVEVAELVKENDIEILDQGATIRLKKTGLYRVSADNAPVAQTFDGKAEVEQDGRKVEIGKNHETVLNAQLKSQRFNDDQKHTELYAWSKVRDEYVAAASFASAKTIPVGGSGWDWGWGGGLGYGYGFGPGWMWNQGWNSWAWLPGSGAFYSPFGYGFFSPPYVAYAPVVITPVVGRPGKPVPVPVNPGHPGVPGGSPGAKPPIVTSSGAAWHPVYGYAAARSGSSAGQPAHASVAGASGGQYSGAGSSGGHISGASGGGGAAHASGGGAHR